MRFSESNQTKLSLFEALVQQRASLRQGNHKVKTRAEVAGGGRKPWRQKEQAVHVKGLSVHHNGVEVESYSVHHQEATATNYRKKFVDLHFFLHFHRK